MVFFLFIPLLSWSLLALFLITLNIFDFVVFFSSGFYTFANSTVFNAVLLLSPRTLLVTLILLPITASFGYLSISNLRLLRIAIILPPVYFRPDKFSIDFFMFAR